ncbi:hypothetical protein PsorP6_010909 [Peronosclerospora sorghi]|uniref:Uncharacterized protein n=1 Tax=Peronosclerospora sorghi TaxID=230839 RepID=A0ACC0VUK3_9STRA|nr:hypothetical protein PsorP6_010909 [Peronosclerospora sorghi]
MRVCKKQKQKSRESLVNLASLDGQEDDYEDGHRKEYESDLKVLNVRVNNLNLSDTSSELIRKDATIGGNQVNVLIGSDADHNIIRPKLGKKILQRRKVRATQFDGIVSIKKNTNVYKVDILVECETYKNVVLTEWELPEQQDVVLGKPWLVQFNPSIDWRTTKSSCLNQLKRWS